MQRPLIWCVVASAATCLAVLLLSGPASALSTGNGGWQWQNPLPQGNGYASGWFLDASHGWLVSGGDIFHTSDGGVTLTVQARHNVGFEDITFADAKHGWAVGDPANANTGTAIVYRTTNGGRRWTRVRLRLVADLNAVSFANTKVGWAISGDAVLHTVDGGLHWSVRQWPFPQRLKFGSFSAVQAGGSRRVWLGGDSGTILRTVNGGATWKQFHTGLGGLNAIHFTSLNNGWAAGGDEIVHTSDGGAHWTIQLTTSDIPDLSGLSFADSQNGWAITSAGGPEPIPALFHTTDGGAHWTQQTAAPSDSSRWVCALTPSDAVIGGGALNRTSDGGATWQPSTHAADGYFGSLDALQFIDAATGWTAGSTGEILKTTNGGVSWSPQVSGTTADLRHMHFINADDGWAVGDQGVIVHTTDGGANWTAQTSGTSYDLTGVVFTDAQNGWATGQSFTEDDYSSGVILHSTDGGQDWTTQYASTADPNLPSAGIAFSAVAFADAKHGWAVGETQGSDSSYNQTVIMHTTDGGATWTQQLDYGPPYVSNEDDATLSSIACTNAEHAVAVGYDENGTEIFRTINGGAKWTRLVQPVLWELDLTDVVFADATHGWAVGPYVVTRNVNPVIRTTDGGRTWLRQFVGPTSGLAALSFVSPTRGWAAGNAANILKTTTGGNAP